MLRSTLQPRRVPVCYISTAASRKLSVPFEKLLSSRCAVSVKPLLHRLLPLVRQGRADEWAIRGT
jgi:hypothetical protein